MAKAKPAASTPSVLGSPIDLSKILPQLPDLSGLPQNWSPATKAAVAAEYAPVNALTKAQQAALTPAQAYSLLSGGGQLSSGGGAAGGGGGGGGGPTTGTPTPPVTPPKIDPISGNPIAAPKQPGWGTMDWSGLNSKLQAILAPYLSGQASAASGNPMAQIMPLLMGSVGQYLGTINPGVTNQATASGMAPLGSGGTVNWGQIGQALQSLGQGGTQQGIGANLLSALSGYLGSQPSAVGADTSGTGDTSGGGGVAIGGSYAQNMGFDPLTGIWYNPTTGQALSSAPTQGADPLGLYEAGTGSGTPSLYFANPAEKQQYANIMASEQPYAATGQNYVTGLGLSSTPYSGGTAFTLTPQQISFIQGRQAAGT